MILKELASRYQDNDKAVVVELDASGARREVTHAELYGLVRERAEELTAAGIEPGHVIGIRAANGVDWLVWDLAAVQVGAVLKAFADDTVIEDPTAFAALHELALLVADLSGTESVANVVAPHAAPRPDSVPATARREPPGDLHSLVYSSGTAGRLKGLKVSRKGTEYVITRFIEAFDITAQDRHLIFLPLANYQQRLSVYCCLWTGADLVLAPYSRVFGAVKAEQPTFLIAPPVFYDTTLALFAKTGGTDSLPEFLGGRIRFLITGMAPIRRRTLETFWAAGVRLLEAYGMTESGMIAWNTEAEHRIGSVGKLIDPDAVTLLPDGELLIRRDAPLSYGYFDTGGAADETYRADGTIVTGDYGTIDADGFLTLLGRKNDVIALGTGRKVHPAEIESCFAGVPGIADLVVVPTPARQLGAVVALADGDSPAARAEVRERIDAVSRGLEPHQRIASVVFSPTPLRGDPRFLTANLKLSRPLAAAYFVEAAAAERGAEAEATQAEAAQPGTADTAAAQAPAAQPGAADAGAAPA